MSQVICVEKNLLDRIKALEDIVKEIQDLQYRVSIEVSDLMADYNNRRTACEEEGYDYDELISRSQQGKDIDWNFLDDWPINSDEDSDSDKENKPPSEIDQTEEYNRYMDESDDSVEILTQYSDNDPELTLHQPVVDVDLWHSQMIQKSDPDEPPKKKKRLNQSGWVPIRE